MKKTANNYAFIDSQNLNLGVRSMGWNVDYKKFRLYLRNKYSVQQAFMFIGFIDGNQKLYTKLQRAGFVLIFKPTVQYLDNGVETVKGNVDAELVLHAAAIEYSHYDKAVIVTGDGDFTCLVEFLRDNQKLLHLLTPTAKYSKLLKSFSQYIVGIHLLKSSFSYQKDQHQRSVETLGLSGHGDVSKMPKKPRNVKP